MFECYNCLSLTCAAYEIGRDCSRIRVLPTSKLFVVPLEFMLKYVVLLCVFLMQIAGGENTHTLPLDMAVSPAVQGAHPVPDLGQTPRKPPGRDGSCGTVHGRHGAGVSGI